MFRGLLDRALYGLALLVLRGFYRQVEVGGRERIPRDRPILLVANHVNGLMDAVLLTHVVGRIPRFLAKAGLWKKRWARPFLAIAGLLPVQRPEDTGSRVSDNLRVFSSAQERLARRRGLVAIFPEGTTHDDPRLARIRTGAARIALGARAAGAQGLVILPVGMAFDDKLALRSRALARVGEPIDLDADIDRFVADGPTDDTNQDAVRRLTAELEDRLRRVSPDYADIREARVLSRAAEIASRTEYRNHKPVPLAEQEGLAQRLARAPGELRSAVIDATARYHLDLDLVGLRDHQLVPGYTPTQLLKGFVSTAAVVAVLAPFAVVGVVVHLLPYYAVVAAGRATRRPVMKGTARALVGLATFPLAWAVTIWLIDETAWYEVLALLVVLPVCGILAVACIERLERARRAWRGWQGLRERRAIVDEVLVDRARLVAAVRAAATAAAPLERADAAAGGLSDRLS